MAATHALLTAACSAGDHVVLPADLIERHGHIPIQHLNTGASHLLHHHRPLHLDHPRSQLCIRRARQVRKFELYRVGADHQHLITLRTQLHQRAQVIFMQRRDQNDL